MIKRKLIAWICILGVSTSTVMTTGCGGSVILGAPGEEFFVDFNVQPDPFVAPFFLDFLFFRAFDDDDFEDFFDDLEDIFDN